MAHDREIGGIRCHEVLERLSAYLDRELGDADVARIEAHLRSCDWCERFGGAMQQLIGELRVTLRVPDPLDDAVRERLARRLDETLCDDR
ncbi:MAG: zf-HC2 domain-containing protein [Myxococcales bacterium]|nr:zf-HC2 domain-containing protein [Myxococcales bacterium]